MKCIFIANAAVGTGLSGSDRIFIELAKRWAIAGHQINICVWEDGYNMCQREGLTEGLSNILFAKWFLNGFQHTPFVLNYILRIFTGAIYALTWNFSPTEDLFIYSCSDFWQDSIPALILKVRFPKSKLIGSFYLAAPNPFKGFREEGKAKLPTLKGIIYYLQQFPIYLLFKHFAQYIFVTSEPDTSRFPTQKQQGHCIIVKGGVDLEKVNEWKQKIRQVDKLYDAVFLGRFHPQKGAVELIDIWRQVVEKLPQAKLIMMGDGPLMSEVRNKINQYQLEKNIIVTGYMFDGEQKYRNFAQSKIAVHPAIYDSGGMAVAEAMAWDLPAVSFDLEALKTYYPQGMIKVPIGRNDIFATKIIELLSDVTLYSQTQTQAKELITNEWSWQKRSDTILSKLLS